VRWFSILQPWLEPRYDMIAQPPPGYDEGDTAQREGMFMIAVEVLHKIGECSTEERDFVRARYKRVLDLLNDPNNPGLIRRFANAPYWGSDSDRLSRDQATPNVIAMGLASREHLRKFFWAHLKHGWLLITNNTRRNGATAENHGEKWYEFAEPLKWHHRLVLKWRIPILDVPKGYRNYNWKLPDLTVLDFHGLYLRAFGYKVAWPLLLITDLALLGGSYSKVYSYGKDAESSDDLNHLVSMYQAKMVMPTPLSWLAFRVYRKRPYPRLSGLRPAPGNPAQACFDHYFRDYADKGPKLEEIYEKVNKHFFG
jgi:hypothetical protein